MAVRKKTERIVEMTIALLVVGILDVAHGLAQALAQPPAEGEKIGVATALTIGAVLIAVGGQLEQGRRARVDIKDLATKLEASKAQAAEDLAELKHSSDRKHEDNSKKFERVDRRLGHIEQTLSFIRPAFRDKVE